MTRRQLLLASPAAALMAQAPQTSPPLPQTPQEELQAAIEQQHRAAAQLDKVQLPMSTEPAFRFEAL